MIAWHVVNQPISNRGNTKLRIHDAPTWKSKQPINHVPETRWDEECWQMKCLHGICVSLRGNIINQFTPTLCKLHTQSNAVPISMKQLLVTNNDNQMQSKLHSHKIIVGRFPEPPTGLTWLHRGLASDVICLMLWFSICIYPEKC